MTTHILTSELSNIIHEAKRKNPELRNAAEKALSDLKALPSTSESQLAGDLQRRPHFINPFLTACKSGNTKLCLPAVTCLQRLIVSGGLPKERLSEVLEGFQECSKQGHDIQLKILQCLPTLLQSYAYLLEGELQSSVLHLCISLQQSKTAAVSSTASATLQQAVSFAFEKVETEDEKAKDIAFSAEVDTENGPIKVRTAAHDAYMVLEDLCLLTEGQKPRFMRNAILSQTFGLELIETVLMNHTEVFDTHKEQAYLIRSRIMPLVTRFLSERLTFAITVRTVRIFCILLREHLHTIEAACEIPLGLLNHMLDSESATPWRRALCMETFRVIYSTPNLALNLYALLDGHENRRNVIQENLATFVRLATEKPALIGIGQQSSIPTGSSSKVSSQDQAVLEAGSVAGIITGELGVTEVNAPGISTQWSSMRVPCLDQPDKSEPPSIPDTYIYSLVLTCINNLSEGLARIILPLTSHEKLESKSKKIPSPKERPSSPEKEVEIDHPSALENSSSALETRRTRSVPVNPLTIKAQPVSSTIQTIANIINQCWPAILATSSTFLYAALDAEFYRGLIRSLQKFTQVAGILRLSTPRDALLTTLAKAAVPPGIIKNDTLSPPSSAVSSPRIPSSSNPFTSTENFFGPESATKTRRDSLDSGVNSLSQRNLMCLRALINLAIALGSILQEAWPIILETLQKADAILAQTGTVASARDYRQVSNSNQTGDSNAVLPSLSSEIAALESAVSRLFQSTHDYPTECFKSLLEAFCALITGKVSALDTDGQPRLKLQRRKTSLSAAPMPRNKVFAISKLGEIARVNVRRLAHDTHNGGWAILIEQLLTISTNFNDDVATRLMAADVLANLTVGIAATTAGDTTEVRIEVQRRSLSTLQEEIQLLYHNLQADQLSPTGTDIDIHRSALEALRAILDECGDSLVAGWQAIFSIIDSVFRPPGSITGLAGESGKVDAAAEPKPIQPWVPAAKTARSAFGSIQFICSDFLSLIREDRLPALIELLAQFSSQKADLNISLTTITLFWNVSDFLQGQIMKRGSPQANGDGQNVGITSGAYPSPVNDSILALWMNLQQKLASIVQDSRSDVRNGAVHTAYRILDHSEHLSGPVWKASLYDVVFKIMEIDVEVQGNTDDLSRDANLASTSQLILKGFADVFGTHLDAFMQLSRPEIEETWQNILNNFDSYLDLKVQEVSLAVFECISHLLSMFDDSEKIGISSIIKVAALWARSLPRDQAAGCADEKTLVAYIGSFKHIYRLTAAVLELSQIQDITNVFQRTIVMSKPAPYSSDVDSPTSLQDHVLESIGLLQATKPGVPAIITSCLARFTAFPYQEQVDKPALSFIAFSKKAMGLLQSFVVAHAHDASIYGSGAFNDVLVNLSDCIGRKYKWLHQGKEPSMWRSATSAAVAIISKCLPILLEAPLQSEQKDEISSRIVQIIAQVADGDRSSTSDNAALLSDETFDLSSLNSLITAVLSTSKTAVENGPSAFYLESDSVSDKTRTLYVCSLFKSSLMHEHSSSFDAQSPLADLNAVRPGCTYDPPFNLRIRMCYFCFDQLFALVARPPAAAKAFEPTKLAERAFPWLMLRCALPLKRYIADQPLRGRMPTPMSQRLELLYVLKKLRELDCGLGAGSFQSGGGAKPRRTLDLAPNKKHLQCLIPLVTRASARTSGDGEVAEALRLVLEEAFGADDVSAT